MSKSTNESVSNKLKLSSMTGSPKTQYYSPKGETATVISHLDLNSIGHSELIFVNKDKSSSSKSSESSESSESSDDYEAKCELFIQIVTDIFNPDEIGDASIYSVISDTELHGASGDESIVAVINIFNDEDLCASFEYLPDEKLITITEIKRCSGDTSIAGSGTHIINNMKKIYFALKSELKTDIKMVIESDQSEIIVFFDEKEDFISLSYLYLFSQGETWYNKLGFREANFDDNSKLVNDFIHRPANSVFTKEDIKQLKVYHVLSNEEDSVQQVYARIMRRIREISNKPSKKILKEFTFFREFSVRTRVFFLFETMTEEQRKLFQRKFTEITFQDTLGLGRHPSTFKKSHKIAKKSSFKKSHKIAKKSSFKKRLLRTKSKKNKK